MKTNTFALLFLLSIVASPFTSRVMAETQVAEEVDVQLDNQSDVPSDENSNDNDKVSSHSNYWFHQLPNESKQTDAQRRKSGVACFHRSANAMQDQEQLQDADPSAPFKNIAESAGINYVHAERRVPPRCLFDDNENRKKVAFGGFCEAEINTAGAAAGDFDGDGFIDIFVSRVYLPPILYRNLGDGSFEEYTEQAGINLKESSSGAAFVDVNKDGHLDLYVTSLATKRFYLYINDGKGHFTEEALERGAAVSTPYLHVGSGVSVGDFDNDGYPDLHTTEWAPRENIHHNRPRGGVVRSAQRLLHNIGRNAPGYFDDVTDQCNVSTDGYRSRSLKMAAGPYGFNSAFTDLDNDGLADLAITGDFQTTVLFWNEGNMTFTEGYRASNIGQEQNGMGSTFGDIDNDGNLDWFLTAIYDEKKRCYDDDKDEWCEIGWEGNRLYLNHGDRSFTDATDKYGLRKSDWAWGTVMFDYDNDGDLDLFIVNGFTIPSTTMEDDFNLSPNQFWVNEDGKFVNKAKEFGMEERQSNGRAVFVFDYDNDGDLDIFVANQGGKPILYENKIGNKNPYLRVRVLQSSKQAENINVDVLGARVYILPGDDLPVQWREIGTGSHLYGHGERVAHFGLGGSKVKEHVLASGKVARVVVYLPATNTSIMLKDVPINSTLLVRQPNRRNANLLNKLHKCPKSAIPSASNTALTQDEESKKEDDEPVAADESMPGTPNLEELNTHRVEEKLTATKGTPLITNDNSPSESYSVDGSNNNKQNHAMGSTWTRLRRGAPAAYADGISEPAGPWRPSARVVSNAVFAQVDNNMWNSLGLNDLHMTFGQFMAHDIDFTSPLPTFNLDTNFAISVPKGDVWFDVENTGTETLRFKRSMYDANDGDDSSPREQVNKITTWIDASNVYGSDGDTFKTVRSGEKGKLAAMEGDLIPFNSKGLGNDNPTGRYVTALHLSGDSRSNEQPGLFALHVVFFREHNRLCDELAKEHPTWTDEQLYQRARQIVAALLQKITVTEYVPATIGHPLPKYTGYNQTEDASVTNEFATAAFRFGHSQVNTHVARCDANGKTIRPYGNVGMRDAFFTPERLTREGGLDPILYGQLHQKAQEVDTHMVDDLRNFLFGPNKAAGGLDLAAANIQRGRDHGLADFNTVRQSYGLKKLETFSEITSNQEIAQELQTLYGNIDDVDLWVGGLAEDHVENGAVGPTFAAILEDQFIRLRNADRFWYQNPGRFTKQELEQLENTTLTDVIVRNSGLSKDEIQKNIFYAPDAKINE